MLFEYFDEDDDRPAIIEILETTTCFVEAMIAHLNSIDSIYHEPIYKAVYEWAVKFSIDDTSLSFWHSQCLMTCQHNTVTKPFESLPNQSMIQDLLIEAISHDRMHKKLNELNGFLQSQT